MFWICATFRDNGSDEHTFTEVVTFLRHFPCMDTAGTYGIMFLYPLAVLLETYEKGNIHNDEEILVYLLRERVDD
jgi:hypothetical protein